MKIPKVNTDQTCDFAERWNYNGIFVQQSPANIQFATDWANVVLASFIEEQVEAVHKRRLAAEEAAKPKITLT